MTLSGNLRFNLKEVASIIHPGPFGGVCDGMAGIRTFPGYGNMKGSPEKRTERSANAR